MLGQLATLIDKAYGKMYGGLIGGMMSALLTGGHLNDDPITVAMILTVVFIVSIGFEALREMIKLNN